MPFTLANRYEDRRPDISRAPLPGYRVRPHRRAQYRLAYTKDGVAEALWTEFSARTAQVTTPASGTVADPVLLIRSGTAGYAMRATGRCTTDTSPNRDGRPSSCGYEPPRNASPRIAQILRPDLFLRRRGRNVAHAPQGVHSDPGSRRHRATAPQSLSPTSPGILSGSRHCSKRCNTSST